MKRKSFVLFLIIMVIALALAGCGGGGASSNGEKGGENKESGGSSKQFIQIGSGGTAGTYYPLAGALAEIWKKNIEGVSPSVQSTGASVANVNLLKDEKADVIFLQNDIAYYAENGIELFEGNAYEDMKGLACLYPETVQIITLKDKGIQTVSDLKGKRVAVGAAGSGTEANARQILKMAGITYDDISVQYLSFAEAANNLKDGNVDAAFITAGFPTAAVQDIAAQHQVQLVSLDDEIVQKLESEYPYYLKTEIPGGTYRNFDEDVSAVSVMAMLAVRADMDEDLVYNLLDSLYNNLDRMKTAHSVGEFITLDSGTEKMSIELHPGAEKFFSEN